MGYRNIMLSNPVDLQIKNQQLIITKGEQYSIPLEDINSIMVECMTIKLSACFLQRVAEKGIAVYICDKTHIPSTVLLPMGSHSRHFKMLKSQLEIGKPFQKRLWQQIVIRKILNQATCLELLGMDNVSLLENLAKAVQSGDKTNIEAKAASYYFRTLFGSTFSRGEDSVVNAALNYGYAIIRGLIARGIVCYGFEPSIGIFHHSELNSFNLADDLIESFRAVVDLFVAKLYLNGELPNDLTTGLKKELYNLLNVDVISDGQKHSVSNGISRLVMSYSRCLQGNAEILMLPELIELKVHRYE